MNHRYDFIIVGGGTAGLALASLISKNFHVLVFEQGENNSNDVPIKTPSYSGILSTNYLNDYFCMTGHSSDNRRLAPLEGETLGGGSSVNGLQVMEGISPVYDEWAAIANDNSWDAEHAKRIFKKYQTFAGVPGYYTPTAHGYKGPVNVRQTAENVPLATLFANSVSAVTNTPNNIDPNDFSGRFGSSPYYQLTERPDKTRESSWTAYFENMPMVKPGKYFKTTKRGSVTVYTSARLIEILWSNCKEATVVGVNISRDGKCKKFSANNKVILSTGFLSPSILMQNGIGNAEYLSSIGVNVKVDSPRVGDQLYNHDIVSLAGAAGSPNPLPPAPPGSDEQGLYSGLAVLDYNNLGTREFQLIGVSGGPSLFIAAALLLQQTASGKIKLNYASPDRVADVLLNSLTGPEDKGKALYIYKVMYQSLVKMGLTPLGPPVNDDDAIWKYVLTTYAIAYHFTAMCKMGTNISNGVVDNNCNVFGVNGLAVCDVSIMPLPAAGNTMSTAYFVAYVLAKKLNKQYKKCTA